MKKSYQTLSILKHTDQDECRNIMSNYDSFVDRIQRMISVQSVYVYLKKAEKCHSEEHETGEKKSLETALYEIKSKNITDEDLIVARPQNYATGTVLTTEKIEMRLKELGWEG